MAPGDLIKIQMTSNTRKLARSLNKVSGFELYQAFKTEQINIGDSQWFQDLQFLVDRDARRISLPDAPLNALSETERKWYNRIEIFDLGVTREVYVDLPFDSKSHQIQASGNMRRIKGTYTLSDRTAPGVQGTWRFGVLSSDMRNPYATPSMFATISLDYNSSIDGKWPRVEFLKQLTKDYYTFPTIKSI